MKPYSILSKLSYSLKSFNLKLKFNLKIDSKMCSFKNLEEIWKIGKKIEKASGNPASTT